MFVRPFISRAARNITVERIAIAGSGVGFALGATHGAWEGETFVESVALAAGRGFVGVALGPVCAPLAIAASPFVMLRYALK